jgi:hypothetical protein
MQTDDVSAAKFLADVSAIVAASGLEFEAADLASFVGSTYGNGPASMIAAEFLEEITPTFSVEWYTDTEENAQSGFPSIEAAREFAAGLPGVVAIFDRKGNEVAPARGPQSFADTFEAENLDCVSIDPADLEALAVAYGALGRYAAVKAQAMRARLAGSMLAAERFERQLEAIYQSLPEWARW